MIIIRDRVDLNQMRKSARYLGLARDWKRRAEVPGQDRSRCERRVRMYCRLARQCNHAAIREFRKIVSEAPAGFRPHLFRWMYWEYRARDPSEWHAELVYGIASESTHPFDFTPDPQSSTLEEQVSHQIAVKDAEAGRAWLSPGHNLISWNYGWGHGVETHWWTIDDWNTWGDGGCNA